jgi:phosphoribosylaminoimidazolecarboxamide formyltransferase/IMP cyclohydrolase
MSDPFRVAVLVSGAGTNLQTLIDRLHLDPSEPVEIALVVASSAQAAALDRARAAGVPTDVVSLADHADRAARDRALAEVVAAAEPGLVVLAGWMSILTPDFLDRFPDRVINLHPSLLPAFPGMHAIEEALAWGVRVTGVTVHFAEEAVDGGPPILQEAVPVVYGDSVESLRARIRQAEHRLLPEAVRLFAAGRVHRDPQRSRLVNVVERGGSSVGVARALVSVSDKTGLEEFARGLVDLGVTLVSTGGTAAALSAAGLEVTPVEAVTGQPEILGGRVKTLHPAIHGGILARAGVAEDAAQLEQAGIAPFDLVVVNLYPFEETAGRHDALPEAVVEQIDIGGPSMIRAAAKNHARVGVVTSPDQYGEVLQELREQGALGEETRRRLAVAAFQRTARYDVAIANWMGTDDGDFPQVLLTDFEKTLDLAYGENPHQRAAYYVERGTRTDLLSRVEQLHGKPLTFNNLFDLNSARALVREFELPACVIVKHNNPCGVAVASDLNLAYERALACDPVSAYGGVIVVNRQVDAALGERLASTFVEVLLAPDYEEEALAALTRKPNTRILIDRERRRANPGERDLRRVIGGMLVQDHDGESEDREVMRVVTAAAPNEREWGDLLFAWRVAKHVKSNAIVLASDLATVGIGAGQMSRVDSVRLAVEKAREADLDLAGAALASDAFFPFADGPEAAIAAGARVLIQPGGSIRDADVIEACDRLGVAMVFTDRRHFRH